MKKSKPIIGILGGTGQMGKLFKKIFEKHKCKVLISSRHTKLTPVEMVKKSDIIIITVPINVTVKVIEKIMPYTRKDQLLMDFTSIKQIPVKAMLKSKAGVVGLHPMFGPGVEKLIKQTIVICPARPNHWYPIIKDIFSKEKAKLKITTPKKHDNMMSIIQGMMHFTSISMCYLLKDMGIDFRESLGYTSPVYRLSLDMVGRILNQDPGLYADIELSNPNNAKVIKTYIKNQQKLLKIIKKQDRKSFIKYFSEASNYLGEFTKKAENDSNILIQRMVKS